MYYALNPGAGNTKPTYAQQLATTQNKPTQPTQPIRPTPNNTPASTPILNPLPQVQKEKTLTTQQPPKETIKPQKSLPLAPQKTQKQEYSIPTPKQIENIITQATQPQPQKPTPKTQTPTTKTNVATLTQQTPKNKTPRENHQINPHQLTPNSKSAMVELVAALKGNTGDINPTVYEEQLVAASGPAMNVRTPAGPNRDMDVDVQDPLLTDPITLSDDDSLTDIGCTTALMDDSDV